MVQLQYSGMLERFKDVPDPRRRPNRIYPWPFLWGLISAAMASACQIPAAIARWIKEHHDELLAALAPSLVRLPCVRIDHPAHAGLRRCEQTGRRPDAAAHALATSACPRGASRSSHVAGGASH